MNRLRGIRRMAREALDLFYPRCCYYTGETLDGKSKYRYVADDVALKVQWVIGPACCSCGVRFDGEVGEGRQCANCRDLDPVFSRGKTAFMMDGPGRKLVHELKYHEGFHLWKDIAGMISQVPGYLDFIDDSVLIPVPLHPRKLRQRGFNQSLLLAKTLVKLRPKAMVMNCLRRVKMTQTQTYLKKDQRYQNVKNAFAIRPGSVINRDSHYILIDDVFTTGATLNECSKVLKKHGATRIDVLTLGHG